MESRGGKRESQSAESDPRPPGGSTHMGSVAIFTLEYTRGSLHSLLFYVISAFLHVSSLFQFCSKYCSIYSPVAHGLNGHLHSTLDSLAPYNLSSQTLQGKQTVCFILQTSKRNPLVVAHPMVCFLRLRCILCLFNGGPERRLSGHP